jgi:hypothetical protein
MSNLRWRFDGRAVLIGFDHPQARQPIDNAVVRFVRMLVTLITRRLGAMKPTVRRRITTWLAMSIAGMMGAAQFVLVGPPVVAPRAAATNAPASPLRIIIDTDFKTMVDDGQVLAMAAQLQAQSALRIMGLCVVSGNDWQPQETAEALKAVERLGIENTVDIP